MSADGAPAAGPRSGAPRLLLGIAIAASALLLLALAADTTFFFDEWAFLLDRRPWNAASFLESHNDHITIIPVLIYKLGVTVFGMDSQRPFQVLLTGVVAANSVLIFIWARRRVGEWLAFAAALPFLFLGSAAFDLLWPFQITQLLPVAFGLGALITLDRGDRIGDRWTCALLVASIATHSGGLPFIAAVAVGTLLGPERGRRAYVWLVPAGLYLLWFAGYGGGGDASGAAIADMPGYVFDGFASSIASLFGLVATPGGGTLDPLDWGRPLLVIALVALAWWLGRTRRITPALATVVVLALSFWLLAAIGAADREPTNGRYQYMGALFIVLVAVELGRDARLRPSVTAAIVALSGLTLIGNLSALVQGDNFLSGAATATKANLAALEIVRGSVAPDAEPLLGVRAGPYFAAADDYGSPATPRDELPDLAEPVRAGVDATFARIVPLSPVEADGTTARDECRLQRLDAGPYELELGAPARPLELEAMGEVSLALRRYATTSFPIALGALPDGVTASLAIDPDRSDVPWVLQASGSGLLRICERAGGPG